MASARYAYLNTRVSLLAKRLITPEAMESLVEQPISSSEEVLSTAGIEPLEGDTSQLEQGLLTHLLRDFIILTRPVLGPERDFLEYLIYWFELTNLKVIIRGKFSGQSDQAIREQLVDIDPFTTLPVDELLRTEDPAEMLRHLETTAFSDIVRQARKVFEEKHDLFALDATIDRRFFHGLYKRAAAVAESERAAVKDITRTLLDRFNLLWLLRYRFSYGLSPAETFYLLVPAGHDLNAAQLLALSQLNSFDEVIAALPPRIKALLSDVPTITEVENRLVKRSEQIAHDYLKDIRHAIARAFAYLLLRDIEMNRLLAIIKGKQLGFAADKIRFAAGMI